MTTTKKSILTILMISIGLTLVYSLLLRILKMNSCGLDLNEFGDYVGGVLNPFFTLLSTSAIIFLTYFIAKNESVKAEEAIGTQKRITLNQMRQESYNNISSKLNLFAYRLNEFTIHDVKTGSFKQRLLTNDLSKDEKEPNLIWAITLYEIEGFQQQKYLFGKLFDNNEFIETYKSLTNIVAELWEEESKMKMITHNSISKYIDDKQKFQTLIGDYILSQF